jgi:hypothetical protein
MDRRGGIQGKIGAGSNRSLWILFFLILMFIIVLGIYILLQIKGLKGPESMKTCGDSTFYDTCSLTKPFFCNQGVLMESAVVCGCPKGFTKKENLCMSDIQKEPREVSFKYVLRGEEGEINFIMYKGIYDYLYTIPRSITYNNKEISSRADFKLKSIDEETQRNFLLPLVIKIQNSAPTKEDQARIAISLVQNIPYGNSNSTITFGGNTVSYFRYPYQVLYDNQGVCGEKVELLAFLLRELGYGVSFFYFPEENHEALGIKCPIKESLANSGYCFIETTGPSIITQRELYYSGLGKIESTPQVFLLADGFALGNNLYEYKDAKRMDRIKKTLIRRDGRLDFFKYLMNKKLKTKYGIDGNLRI